jgi:hypothetical protein
LNVRHSRSGVTRIRTEIENSDYDREKLQERLAKLAGGVAVIKAGAATEVEVKERKYRGRRGRQAGAQPGSGRWWRRGLRRRILIR